MNAADETPGPAHRVAGETAVLPGQGPAAYLDGAAFVALARLHGCDALHPGYGFLSERADFAQACVDAGLVFVGPTPAQLACFGDKAQARALAAACGVPLLPGSDGAVTLAQAQDFMAAQGGAGVMLKAVAGGGGRGMRAVHAAGDLAAAHARCTSEARAAFGRDGVYVERLMHRARHIELQIVGDGQRWLSLGERECSLQRRFQKLVEIAPSPGLTPALRSALEAAALAMARACGYVGLGTFEFLVKADDGTLPFVFIEANARLQVEHTVTEMVTGLDLVRLQIELAAGRALAELIDAAPAPRGCALQWRINAETLDLDGHAQPGSGTLQRLQWPAGPGIRIDIAAESGADWSGHCDSLLAKLVVHGRDFAEALRRSQRALHECGIDGVAHNLDLLCALAARPELAAAAIDTGFVEAHLTELLPEQNLPAALPADATELRAPMAARLVQWSVQVGDTVAAGAEIAVLEAMKMEHVLSAPQASRVCALFAAPGAMLHAGQPLLRLEPVSSDTTVTDAEPAGAGTSSRADLQRLRERQSLLADAARPDAVAKRHAQGQRTARENIAALCDADSFIEYGAFAVAAQRRRRSADDLMRNTPADGLVAGVGSINTAQCADTSRAVVMAYDATVLAGTQGFRNHQKTDRLLGLALQNKLPLVLWAEGGGGRPGDTDMPIVAGLHVRTFAALARLSGQVPTLGIAAGRCFAGNAALLGCCDTVIATRNSNIGMGGPAMVEGGGLGVFKPEQIGPAAVQWANGVIDLLVDDEAEAAAVARRYLGYFQGPTTDWACADPALLRDLVPTNRLRVYDVRQVLQGLFDTGSVLELRAGFGVGIVTALARLEGRPVGVFANNPLHLGGAIDADAADKAARFMQLCNAHGLPLVSLVDTPGFMVGPQTEEQAQVRHVSRLFVTAAALRVPFFSLVLRKGYGLGAMGMAAGSFHAPDFIAAWPTGEFGAMGLEGAVRLGYRKELEAVPAGPERDALYQRLVAQQYEAGGALNMAATLEIDAVIDPAHSRDWLRHGLASARLREPGHRFIDTW